jgi:hypothetical protein
MGEDGGGGSGKRWWEEMCNVAAFEPWLPDLGITKFSITQYNYNY